MKDLVVLVADGTMQKVVEEILLRVPRSSGTSDFTFDVIPNIGHDSGCYNDSHELLRSFSTQYRFAMVIFDFEGSGVEIKSINEIENDVERLLDNHGWQNRNSVAVINPELENWIWQDSPHIEEAFGWENNTPLYQWCRTEGLIAHGDSKPIRPKETMQRVLKFTRTPFSSAIHKKIAKVVSYKRCTDRAFLKILNQLKNWFPRHS
ncbi:MAG: hypothetical protein J0L54_14825 [Chitinophagales bacterium]|nr:hypothetical protein [Chitinophagales bacterium]